jgi:hypothetical protein
MCYRWRIVGYLRHTELIFAREQSMRAASKAIQLPSRFGTEYPAKLRSYS